MSDIYKSPLSTRYASRKMQELFSEDTRYTTWRKLWVSLAKAEKEMGLPITDEQIGELTEHIYDIDYDVVRKREQEVRHDVMAHIYAYGKLAPKAAGILHLGATSCYVTDNADLIIYRDALNLVRTELISLCAAIADFADKYKSMPTLGYTHYQPAQLVTVGKRACLWLDNFVNDVAELDFVISQMKLRGARGTTGTEASFMELYDGDEAKIDQMNALIAKDFGFEKCFPVCGQTYPRKMDSLIVNVLSSIAQSAYKMAEDIRLLQHDRQVEEPFEEKQIGSSAMAYKRNPMRCERICSLSRYLISQPMNAAMTASTQWMERTLDDSAIRRISIPEAFMCCDGILRLAVNVTSGLHVNDKIVEKRVREYLPFIATENILMEAVKRGGDRQELHEIIRQCSMETTAKMKNGEEFDLISLLAARPELQLSESDLSALLEGSRYIGRSVQQVDNYLAGLKKLLEEAEGIDSEIKL
ncbi:MAG: adenylosuccinate lyase [Clostridiales bacterium]|nr:adenylosuccinate lyase [Candidatus Crickella caballi]